MEIENSMGENQRFTSNTQKAVHGISSQTMVTIVLGVFEIASFAIMSRLLTKEDFGYYAAISAITAIFATFSDTGIGSAIIQQKKLTPRYINNAFTLSFLFGSIVSVIMLAMAGILANTIIDNNMRGPLMLMAITLVFHSLTSVNTGIMYRKLQFLQVGLISLISLVVTTVIAITLAYNGYGFYAILTKAILASIITYILSLILCKTKYHLAFDIDEYKKIFKFSGWLMASSLFRNLAHQIDRLMMPRLLSVSALGAYNRPKEFIEQISSKLNGIFDTALFPILSDIQDDKQKLGAAFRRSMFYLNGFAMMVTLAFVFNSELIIRIFFGDEWLHIKIVAMILACTLVFNIDGRLADCYLRSLAMTKEQFFFRIFETLLKILGLCIGYRWGIVGIAGSVTITNTIAKLIKINYISFKVNISVRETLKIILSSWKFTLAVTPICLFAYYSLPVGLMGNIMLAIIFMASVMIVFTLFPNMVGEEYAQTIHPQLLSRIKNKLHITK